MEVKKNIVVIFGGQSSEHEVSRVSAQSVVSNINPDKFNLYMIGITKDGRWLGYDGPVEKLGSGEWQQLAEAAAGTANAIGSANAANVLGSANTANAAAAGSVNASAGAGSSPKEALNARSLIYDALGDRLQGKADVIFPVMHGINAEDGTIQGLFELMELPYVGCGVLASSVGMDKVYTKIIFENAKIPQGKYLVFTRKQIQGDMDAVAKEAEAELGYPCFVKPSNAGSSVGVGKAADRKELAEALKNATRYDRKVLVEEFINGREIECAVLGNDEPLASVAGEIIPCKDFYDYEAKYQSGDSSKTVIPAELSEETANEIRALAVKAYKALDCSGLSRVDFFVHKETGRIYINEINTLPGFTSISMYPKLWEATGLPYGRLIEKLVELAEERFIDNRKEI